MLNKQGLSINFAQGLDTKSDPFQVSAGKFLTLQNSVFDKTGRLTKRNGFGALTALPDSSSLFLTTFNGSLTAIGTSLNAYSDASDTWTDKGDLLPISLATLPLIRSNLNQSQADSAVSSNGLVCTVYTDNPAGGASYKYVVADVTTGQNIVSPTVIPVASGTVTGSPRVFVLGNYFIILFTNVITATSHLQYIAVNASNPTQVTANTDIASAYISATTLSFDGFVANNNLYIAYNTTTGGQSIKVTYLSTTLGAPVAAVTFAGRIATVMSVTADITTPSDPIIYASFYDSAGSTGYTLAVDKNLNTILAPTQTISALTLVNLTSSAVNGVCTIFYETTNSYASPISLPSNFISYRTIAQAGTLGTATVLKRSVGLASKAFIVDDVAYLLSVYSSAYQPTYFLLDGSGNIISKLAYGNAGPYRTAGLPGVSILEGVAQIAYLMKDLVQAANKQQNPTSATPVYSQTGINLIKFTMSTSRLSVAEIGSDLHISGGYLAMYDGYLPVEHSFFLYPDSVTLTGSAAGGTMTAQQYFYQVTYEWSDNQGNIFRSAPSLPKTITTTGATSSVTLSIPTLRLTYKTANPVKIVVYRWSAANQTYYQVTSIAAPTLNNTAVDSIDFVDILPDSSILGNNILYTTGGIIENIAAPATNLTALFNNRLFLVDAENPNLLWFSKQVIEATPVEMSDLLTIYVAPTTSAQGSTGPIKALSAMDDKLILFKKNAIYYINGQGPDNTGANSQYSDATFITSTVGCSNQQSIVFIPSGLMFQSDKGIWLLDRSLNTQYIGAAVEAYTLTATVNSAVNVPGTNQVRFTLDSGITLMYDYYFQQWGTFTNVPAVSSTIYGGKHTYINSLGLAYQEASGSYLDGSTPVLMAFTTSWINAAGLQGYERFYQLYLLGQYITPFKLTVQIAYDYNSSFQQSTIVTPEAPSGDYGNEALWGSGEVYGGPSNVFEARVFPEKQKCESFQISVSETYDPSLGLSAGAGLTLSEMEMIIGIKKGYRTQSSGRSFG